MAHRTAVRPHATYIPQPPRPQRAPVSHAAPVASPHPVPSHARTARPAATRAERHSWVAGLVGLNTALLVAIGLALVVVVRHVPAVFHGVSGQYLFSALVAGTVLILVRSSVNGDGHGQPHRSGPADDRPTNRAVALLARGATGEVILLAAVLLAWGEAVLAATLAT